jgi:toxin YoeB
MVKWKLVFTRHAPKDAKKLSKSGLRLKTEKLLALLKDNPLKTPSPFEKLVGDLRGAYSRRINIQHRLVYQVLKKEKTVKVLRMWTHYE